VAEGVRENGEEANERERGFQRGCPSFYLPTWARSRVFLIVDDWLPWAAYGGGVVSWF
jgi:hypothetical protein